MTKENVKFDERNENNCECHIEECSCDVANQNKSDEINWQDQALRALAEIKNIQHRSQLEIERGSKMLVKDFAKDIISILDSYDYAFNALKNMEQNDELKGVIDGFKVIYELFLKILSKHNIVKIPTIGVPFNPNLHLAVMFEKGKNNEIIKEVGTGFMMGNEVLREASVILGKE